MKKEIRLVKTCIGLVSEYAIMCLADRATEIALGYYLRRSIRSIIEVSFSRN